MCVGNGKGMNDEDRKEVEVKEYLQELTSLLFTVHAALANVPVIAVSKTNINFLYPSTFLTIAEEEKE